MIKILADKSKVFNIKDLKSGMILAEEVKSDFGGVLIPPGTELTARLIAQMEEMGLEKIKIRTEKKAASEEDKKKIGREKYNKSIEKFSETYQEVYKSKKVNFNIVKSLTEEAMEVSDYLDLEDTLKITRNIDDYTYSHSLHVGILANKFGKWLQLSEDDLADLTTAALLLDIGKTRVDKNILTKKAALTEAEYAEAKKHSEYGYQILKESGRFSKNIMRGVLTHHERFDGSGYPLGLKGDDIPLFGRIIGICDTFDAVTTDRPYQKAVSPFTAIKILDEDFASFDHSLKMLFIEKIPYSLIGDQVELSDGRKAKVVFINPAHPESPIVKVGAEYLDLNNERQITIVKLIKDLKEAENSVESL